MEDKVVKAMEVVSVSGGENFESVRGGEGHEGVGGACNRTR